MYSLLKDDKLQSGNSLYLFLSSFPCSSVTVLFHFGVARSRNNLLHDGCDGIVFCT